MASGIQHLAATIQLSNYASFVILTAAGYDYALTLADEIEYIWNKPWTRVSTLFFLARYFGLCSLIFLTIISNSLIRIPGKVIPRFASVSNTLTPLRFVSVFIDDYHILTLRFQGGILINCGALAFWIMVAAADMVMILRVWALYNRSRTILFGLLPLYAIEVVGALVGSLLLRSHTIPGDALYVSVCEPRPISIVFSEVIDGLQLSLGASMYLLLVTRFIREAIQMYSVTNRFQLNRYMSLLLRDGMFYFLAILLYAVINLLNYIGGIPMDGWWILLRMAEYLPMYTLVPRLILSLRELYSRDLRRRRGTDIDSAFGFTSSTPVAIVFAENAQNDTSERRDEIVLEEWDTRDTRSV